MRSNYSTYLREQSLSPAQIAAGQQGVHNRVRRRAVVRRVRVIATACFVAVLGAGLWQRVAPHNTTLEAFYIATSEEKLIRLPEGSLVRLQPHGELRVHRHASDDIVLEVARGEALFDVTHRDGRAFSVRAGSSTIDVIGTRFSVAIEDAVVVVRVAEGAVMVHDAGRPAARVAAGEEWTNAPSEITPSVQPPSVRAVEEGPINTPKAPPKPQATRKLGASDLLQDARAMAANDEVALAVDLYRQLRRDFPQDARAAGAMFEAGRLLQDRLRSFAESADAYADALELQPRAPWREDALARRVQVLELLRRTTQCEQERAQYLSEYPDGVHAPLVQRSCAWQKP